MRRLIAGSAAALAALGLMGAVSGSAEARTARLGDRTLERGDRGADVRELQRTMRRLKLRTSIDGVYGRDTAAKVRRYERRVRIAADGKVSTGQARGMRKRAGLPFAGDPSQATAPNAAPRTVEVSGGSFPVQGKVRWGDGFATRGGRHQGVDLLADCGTPLVSPVAGQVMNVKTHTNAGHYVVIRDAATGEEHVLMHLA